MTPMAIISGTGFAVPHQIITNNDLKKIVETSDEWIQERTGIKERRILLSDEDPIQLAVKASCQAMEEAHKKISEVDLLISVGSVPYKPIPGTGPYLKEALGIVQAIPVREVNAACAGSIQAMEIASEVIALKKAKCVLICALEVLSRSVNWQDRNTCVLFGDAAGAVIIEPSDNNFYGILATTMHCASQYADAITIKLGGAKTPLNLYNATYKDYKEKFIELDGQLVFKRAGTFMSEAVKEVLTKANFCLEDLDWLIPHQANLRIIKQVAARLNNFPQEKTVINIERYGNTSSASILIALAEIHHDPEMNKRYPIEKDDIVVLTAIGAGFHYGAAVLKGF